MILNDKSRRHRVGARSLAAPPHNRHGHRPNEWLDNLRLGRLSVVFYILVPWSPSKFLRTIQCRYQHYIRNSLFANITIVIQRASIHMNLLQQEMCYMRGPCTRNTRRPAVGVHCTITLII